MIPEFELDRREVRSAFERAAATYDEAAVLQREIAGRLLERLDYVRLSPVRVLDAGCGTRAAAAGGWRAWGNAAATWPAISRSCRWPTLPSTW